MLQEIFTVLEVKVNYNFGVGVGAEFVALFLQFSTLLLEIINFAIVGHDDATVETSHGHVAEWREIDDGETAIAESDGTLGPSAAIIRPAVNDAVSHATNDCLVDFFIFETDDAGDATH